MNITMSKEVISQLALCGVSDYIYCAGARNAPMIESLVSADNLTTYSFFDERSAAFFALGKAKNLKKPIVVTTTSGSAVAEMLPAVMEAYYSQVPLILLTADRPKSYRGSGAPQAVEQSGIFSHYTVQSFDIDCQDKIDLSEISLSGPVHINICFDEPLLDEEVSDWSVDLKRPTLPMLKTKSVKNIKIENPLIIVSSLDSDDRAFVKNILLSWNYPLYLEGTSGLRGDKDLQHLALLGGDKFLEKTDFFKESKSIIRIGGVPTLRLWRDLEKKLNHLVVHSFSNIKFSGLSRVKESPYDLDALKDLQVFWDRNVVIEVESSKNQQRSLDVLMEKLPFSEVGLFRKVSNIISEDDFVFIGNSLAIREWDLASVVNKNISVMANRGVNGIDGLVSTFLGAVKKDKVNWLILGDLSALYDLSALWAMEFVKDYQIKIVVINNKGGKIFSRIFKGNHFENSHSLNFQKWAEMFNLDYLKVEDSVDTLKNHNGIVEVIPCCQQSERFWEEYTALCQK